MFTARIPGFVVHPKKKKPLGNLPCRWRHAGNKGPVAGPASVISTLNAQCWVCCRDLEQCWERSKPSTVTADIAPWLIADESMALVGFQLRLSTKMILPPSHHGPENPTVFGGYVSNCPTRPSCFVLMQRSLRPQDWRDAFCLRIGIPRDGVAIWSQRWHETHVYGPRPAIIATVSTIRTTHGALNSRQVCAVRNPPTERLLERFF